MSNKKEEIKKELDELGVDYDGRLGEEKLQELLDNHGDDDESDSEESDNEEDKSDEVHIYRGKLHIRSYTKEVHGKDYKKLAETYVSTRDDNSLRIE